MTQQRHVVRVAVSDQYIRVNPTTGKADFTRHLGEATRFDTHAESAKVLGALPHSLGARRMEVRK